MTDTRFAAEARRIALWANTVRLIDLSADQHVEVLTKRIARALAGARDDALAEAAGRQAWAEQVGQRPYADLEESAGG